MDFFRYRSDAWGQRVLEGVSWDLLWVFVGAAVVFIVFHAIYTHRKLKGHNGDD
jgi:cobalamin synthase